MSKEGTITETMSGTSSNPPSTRLSSKGPLWIALIVAIVVLVVGFGLRAAQQIHYNNLTSAQKVEVICEDLRAPGDPSTVAQSSFGLAYEIRQQVATDLQNGMTKDQILSAMVSRYGDSVLAVPRFQGFGVMTWFAPLAVALLVLWGVFSFIRRSARTKPGQQREEETSVDSSGTVTKRLKDYL